MTKNPFRGIAVAHQVFPRKIGSNQRYYRHIEGPRDESPTWRNRDTDMKDLAFRNPNPLPATFTE